jgi:CRISPR/Cas system-associated exonuclease Cas4 (RecB family)
MQPFLDKLAHHLLDKHGQNFSRICLVFPSRRAGLFFKQYVSRLIDKPIWLPDIYALEDFVVHKSGLTLSDPLDLIARLYKVYKSIEKDKAQPFTDFISWGNMLLGDFDEIDQYLADGEKVFQYLDEIKALKHWNPDGKPLTSFEISYLRFYNSLAPTYTRFREELLKNSEAYFGLAFDTLMNDIEHKSFGEWDSIVFAGFNALTAAEESLLKYLVGAGKAEIYWDADDYYLLDSRQEAGRFLREYIHKNTFGQLNWIGNSLSEDAKSIYVTGVPGNVGQAKLAGELLTEIIKKKGSADGIALVLVDEGLLLPVLNSIPAISGDFNVTMGFPLKQTPVFSLFSIVISMFANAKRFAQLTIDAKQGELPVFRFYHKDIQRFLSHPFIVSVAENSAHDKGKPARTLVSRSFYYAEDLLAVIRGFNSILADVFNTCLVKKNIEPADILQLLKKILSFLRDALSASEENKATNKKNGQSIDTEYLYHAAQLCSKLEVVTNDPDLKPDFETLLSLVTNLIAGMRLPFYGEPLNGLQVMGMLETRLLDFTDIIMMSVNEGLLPRGKQQSTFIPDEVRTHFGMQRYTERTAVFAYHFYRLMQRVENAWLVYNTEGDELGGGEKSRFISQMLYELPSKNQKLEVSEQTLSVVPGDTRPREISIGKTPEVYNRLRQLAERGLSPTAISMYLKCKLQFYFSQVLKISEPDQVSETIDAATLGEIVHDALQKIYEARKTELITPEVLNTMLQESASYVQAAFALKFNLQEIATGKNLLIARVAGNMVKRFLTAEKNYLEQTGAKIEILMLEEELESFVEIADPFNGEIYRVKFYGKADRVDRVGGVTRIIDYKTGKVEAKDLKLDQIGNFREKEDPAKLLQVLTYALMFRDMRKNEHMELNSGIISLRKTSAYFIKTDINKSDSIDPEILRVFKSELQAIVGDIYLDTEPFSQTENLETCSLCAFNTICNRTVN